MGQANKLQEEADRRGITEFALVINAVEGASNLTDAADKLNVSRQALDAAMERLGIETQRISYLKVLLRQRNGVSP